MPVIEPTYELAFVAGIADPPTVRLDLNDQVHFRAIDPTNMGVPSLRRAVYGSYVSDGDHIPASAYAGRTITLVLDLSHLDPDAATVHLQLLSRELDRPTNILRYRPGTARPMFFVTARADYTDLTWDASLQRVTVNVPAEPFGYGLPVTIPAVTVYNDPTEATTTNGNPFFETDAAGWTPTGGTFARSTAQFHEGAAAGLLTPDGVTAEVRVTTAAPSFAAAVGSVWHISGWARCAVARTVGLRLRWHDAADAFLSSSTAVSISVAANTWTFFEGYATAPASTAGVRLDWFMTGTPAGSNLLYVDEVRIRPSGGVGGMFFDLPPILGDVETPLTFITDDWVAGNPTQSTRYTTRISTRRRGDPDRVPFYLPAESMTLGTDATTTANAEAWGLSVASISFATATYLLRLSTAVWPATPHMDLRGTYRILMRYKQSASGASNITVGAEWGAADGLTVTKVKNPTVALPSDTGPAAPTWRYADLGTVTYPPGGIPATDDTWTANVPEGIYFSLMASRASGTVTLQPDGFLLVPDDDQTNYVLWPITATTPDNPDEFLLASGHTMDGSRMAAQVFARKSGNVRATQAGKVAGGAIHAQPGIGVRNRVWWLRDVGDRHWNNDSGDDKFASGPVSLTYLPRYLVLRPETT